MNVAITLNKPKVLREVNKLTAFTARQISGGFDRIAATTDEERIVLSFMEQAISELSSKLVDYHPLFSDSAIDFDLPSTFDLILEKNIEDAIVNYLVNEICARWFSITKPDEKRYSEGSNILSGDVLNLLCVRNKPKER